MLIFKEVCICPSQDMQLKKCCFPPWKGVFLVEHQCVSSNFDFYQTQEINIEHRENLKIFPNVVTDDNLTRNFISKTSRVNCHHHTQADFTHFAHHHPPLQACTSLTYLHLATLAISSNHLTTRRHLAIFGYRTSYVQHNTSHISNPAKHRNY